MRGNTMKKFSIEEAQEIAGKLGIDFDQVDFSDEDFLTGINIELEHGTSDPETNVTGDDPLLTGKIALAHLSEFGLYYNKDIGLPAWEKMVEYYEGDPEGKKLSIQ
jgi:hypothetical protein